MPTGTVPKLSALLSFLRSSDNLTTLFMQRKFSSTCSDKGVVSGTSGKVEHNLYSGVYFGS